jgi:putative Mg2+ transporter-C (MgtC) family protein
LPIDAAPGGCLLEVYSRAATAGNRGAQDASCLAKAFTRETSAMEQFWNEIVAEFPSSYEAISISFRLILAVVLGAIPGWQRELTGQAAGLRTHMMVSLGAAVFVMAAVEAGASVGDTTRVIQGLATGIGFVGAGAILKSKQDHEVRGLTTASSIWLTAGLGTAVGLGRVWLPLLGAVLAVIILSVLGLLGDRIGPPPRNGSQPGMPADHPQSGRDA